MIYNPFEPNNTAAFVFGDRLTAAWAERASAFARHQPQIASAVSRGLQYNALGLAFPPGPVWPEVGVLRGMCYESDSDSSPQRRSVRAVLEHRMQPRSQRAPPLDGSLSEVLHALRRDGYYRFNASWGFARALRHDGARQRLMEALDEMLATITLIACMHHANCMHASR